MSLLPLPPAQPEQTTLRLYNAAAAEFADHDESSATLAEFFEAYVRPVCLTQAAARNLDQYRQSLRYWRQGTSNPPVRDIDAITAAGFVTWLRTVRTRAGEALADNTVRKHAVAIQFCLDRAGPPTRQNPQGRGLLAAPPLVPKPSLVIEEVTGNYTLAEIASVLTACSAALTPRPAPATWWTSLVVFAYNTGLRAHTLLAARWEWLETDDTGTWLRAPASAMKGRKRGRRIYVNQPARAALERVRPLTGGAGPLFPWPYTDSWLHQHRRLILAASPLPKSRRLGFHALRKACATELGRYSDTAAAMQLGHSGGSVTLDHYQSRTILAEQLEKLPQPAWPAPDPQRLLF